jgi:aromatase
MPHRTHRKVIRAAAVDVYSLCANPRMWPGLFAPCRRAEVLEETAGRQLIRITADACGTPMTWESERALDPASLTIRFRQVRPQWPVTAMEGTWECLPTSPGQTLVLLHHAVEVDPKDPNREAHLARIVRAIDQNTTAELQALAERAEGQAELTFSDKLYVPGPARLVYELLYRAEDWVDLLPHCSGLTVLYDDGSHQELCMRVQTPTGVEEIRTVRYGKPPAELCYFQPNPPAPLATHTGSWQIRYPVGHGVEVIGQHTIRLRWRPGQEPGEARAELDQVRDAIRGNTRATLKALARHCGRDRS